MVGVIETLQTYFAYVIVAIVTIAVLGLAFLIGIGNVFGQILIVVGVFMAAITGILFIKTSQKILSP